MSDDDNKELLQVRNSTGRAISIRVHESEEDAFKRTRMPGTPRLPKSDSVVLEPGLNTVEADFIREWLDENAELDMVKNKLVSVVHDDKPEDA